MTQKNRSETGWRFHTFHMLMSVLALAGLGTPAIADTQEASHNELSAHEADFDDHGRGGPGFGNGPGWGDHHGGPGWDDHHGGPGWGDHHGGPGWGDHHGGPGWDDHHGGPGWHDPRPYPPRPYPPYPPQPYPPYPPRPYPPMPPQPYPPAPPRPYPPVRETVYLTCTSYNGMQVCPVYGEVEYVELYQRYSNFECIYGQSWGYNRDSIWVSYGCSAQFQVTLLRR